MAIKKSPKKHVRAPKEDVPPKRIVEDLGRLGNKYAWLEHVMMDWGTGKPQETYIAGVPDGAFALPILENGNIILVHQYRPVNRGWVYEIPGGIIDDAESEESAALREVEEEAGYRAAEVEKIFMFNLSPAVRCTCHIYVARRLTKTKQRLDPSEQGMGVVELTPTQAYAMVLDGTIMDSMTVLAVLVAKERGFLKVRPEEMAKGHPF